MQNFDLPVGEIPRACPNQCKGEELKVQKRIAYIFWDRVGALFTDMLSKKTTINSDHFTDELEVMKRERHGKIIRKFLLQHGNAMPHVSALTFDALNV